ncbi:MAG: hypothetical protein WBG37_14105, partial [Desulfobacterales bacterium]
MIGRYSKLGVYQELFRLRDFYLTLVAAVLALFSFLVDHESQATSLLGNILAIVSVTINGAPIVWGAVKGLLEREVNVDELVSLAIIASLIQGEFLTAAVVSFVMTFGGLIEQVTSESARKAIKSLVRISPATATIITDEEENTVPIDKVSVGDRILIKPGEGIPADATILS